MIRGTGAAHRGRGAVDTSSLVDEVGGDQVGEQARAALGQEPGQPAAASSSTALERSTSESPQTWTCSVPRASRTVSRWGLVAQVTSRTRPCGAVCSSGSGSAPERLTTTSGYVGGNPAAARIATTGVDLQGAIALVPDGSGADERRVAESAEQPEDDVVGGGVDRAGASVGAGGGAVDRRDHGGPQPPGGAWHGIQVGEEVVGQRAPTGQASSPAHPGSLAWTSSMAVLLSGARNFAMMAAMAKNSKVRARRPPQGRRGQDDQEADEEGRAQGGDPAGQEGREEGGQEGRQRRPRRRAKDKPEKPTGEGLPGDRTGRGRRVGRHRGVRGESDQGGQKDAGVKKRFSEVLAFTRGDQLADISPDSTPGSRATRRTARRPSPTAPSGSASSRSDCSPSQGRWQALGAARHPGHGHLRQGGILDHVVGAVGPQGVKITSFKAPTAEERAHDFLWRIENALPGPGQIGVFDRSHYEDVLIVKVHSARAR